MEDSITPRHERLARANALDAKLRSDIQKLVTGINSWPLAERRAFMAQWIDKLEQEPDSPVAKMMAAALRNVWMSQ